MQVAAIQFAPEKGKLAPNLDRIAEGILQAAAENCDLVAFPETATTGYFLEGGVVELCITAEELAAELTQRLAGKLGKEIDVITGYYQLEDGNIYNSSAFLRCNAVGAEHKSSYQKFFLPTYGVFDEDRFVSRGRSLGVVDTKLGKTGMMICEDVWHSIFPTMTAVAGATTMVIPSASPARGFSGEHIENHDRYGRLVKGISEEHGVFCILCQLVGFEGGKGFVGGSMITDPFGRVLVEAPVGKEAIIIAELDLGLVQIARASTPLISDLQAAWPTIQSLVTEAGEVRP